jgi:hypothetical protein
MKREMQYRGITYTVEAKKPAKKASKTSSNKNVIRYRGATLNK